MRISVIIPTYEMGGKGYEIIQHAFHSLEIQKFKDFEVIVSDQSEDVSTQLVCKIWESKLNIVYVKYLENKGYYTANTNNALRHASGEIIKYLDADDFLFDENSLYNIHISFEPDIKWLVADYVHSYDRKNFFNRHSPVWNDKLYAFNTIGSPLATSVLREHALEMDEYYRWMGDADLHHRMYQTLGEPAVLRSIIGVHMLWDGQTSHTMSSFQQEELNYAKNKFGDI